jgi:hypothetical protein
MMEYLTGRIWAEDRFRRRVVMAPFSAVVSVISEQDWMCFGLLDLKDARMPNRLCGLSSPLW